MAEQNIFQKKKKPTKTLYLVHARRMVLIQPLKSERVSATVLSDLESILRLTIVNRLFSMRVLSWLRDL